jgi:hypothetical protein
MINEISQFMAFAMIGTVYGILLDEIFISIQHRFRRNRMNKCLFAIIQLIVSVILLWYSHIIIINHVNLSISALMFTLMYYSTQNNLWNNMLAFKYTKSKSQNYF